MIKVILKYFSKIFSQIQKLTDESRSRIILHGYKRGEGEEKE